MSLLFSRRFRPFPAQREFIIHPARFKAICTGRRFGKTLGAMRLVMRAAASEAGDYAWIAPTYPITERGMDAMREMVNPQAITAKGKPTVATLYNGARIFFLSADSDDPRSILGHGFKGIVVDEAARVSIDAWQYVIRPTISQTMGWAALFSTPKGRNWFYDIFTRGMDADESEYAAFTYPSIDNPYFPQSEYDEARRTLPSMVFRQEYQAEFLEDSAGVFRGVDECLREKRSDSRVASIGIDLAKHQDYTVILPMGRDGDVKGMQRFNQIDWPAQKSRIIETYHKLGGVVMLDATGVGDPIYDDLRRAGVNVRGVKLTSQSKTELIQGLMVAIEQREVAWSPTLDILTNELKRYEYEYLPSGTVRYNAPAGYHDDCVIALALARQGVNPNRGGSVMLNAW